MGAVVLLASPFAVVASSSGAPGSSGALPQTIVLSADRVPSLTGEIYLVDVDGRLIALSRSPAQDTQPLVSPDGRRVAFVTERDGYPALYVVGTDGSGLANVSRRIFVGGGIVSPEVQFAWSPDSTRLVALTTKEARGPAPVGDPNADHISLLYLLQPGHSPALIARERLEEGLDGPAWAPDGRLVTVTELGTLQVRAFSTAGRRLWSVPGGALAWSARGALAVRADGRIGIYDERGRRLSDFPARGFAFAWSPHGDRLASVSRDRLQVRTLRGRLSFDKQVPGLAASQNPRLVWINETQLVIGGVGESQDSQVGVDLSSGKTWRAKQSYFEIRSPDGTRVASVVTRNRVSFLRVSKLDGSDPRRVVGLPICLVYDTLAGNAVALQFANGGRSLVYQSECEHLPRNLYTIAPDGGGLRPLTRTRAADQTHPTWSPDGKGIAFASAPSEETCGRGCPQAIWVMDADGSDARQLTRPGDCTFDNTPTWSPDGRSILFARGTCQGTTLFVVPVSGGPPRRLHLGGYGSAWGPEKIAFIGDDDRSIWTALPDGSHPRRIARAPKGSVFTGQLAWSRDGRLAWIEGKTENQVIAVLDRNVIHVRTKLNGIVGLSWSPDGRSLVAAARSASGVADAYIISLDSGRVTRITPHLGVSGGVSWR